MPFTVFYAWQTDTSPDLNRSFIQQALESAIKQLNSELCGKPADLTLVPSPALDEPDENSARDVEAADSEIVLQSGASGMTGAPAIADVILARIKTCGVFVGDVSFVTKFHTFDKRTKSQPNANVLIEVGAAALTADEWDRVLLVLNTASGAVDELPFDLKHRDCGIQYDLRDPNDPQRASKRQELTKALIEKIRPIYRKRVSLRLEAQKMDEEKVAKEGVDRAEAEREHFEQQLLTEQFYTFRAKICILAVTILPLVPLKKELDFSKNELVLTEIIQPFLGDGRPPEYRAKSVITGGVSRGIPDSLVELKKSGSIFACYNLVYLRDEISGSWELGSMGGTPVDPAKPYPLSMARYQTIIIQRVQRFLHSLKELNVNGPWFFSISLLNVKNCILMPLDYPTALRGRGRPYDKEHVKTDYVILPADVNIADDEHVTTALAEPLGELWRAFGYRTYPRYFPDGRFQWAGE